MFHVVSYDFEYDWSSALNLSEVSQLVINKALREKGSGYARLRHNWCGLIGLGTDVRMQGVRNRGEILDTGTEIRLKSCLKSEIRNPKQIFFPIISVN